MLTDYTDSELLAMARRALQQLQESGCAIDDKQVLDVKQLIVYLESKVTVPTS